MSGHASLVAAFLKHGPFASLMSTVGVGAILTSVLQKCSSHSSAVHCFAKKDCSSSSDGSASEARTCCTSPSSPLPAGDLSLATTLSALPCSSLFASFSTLPAFSFSACLFLQKSFELWNPFVWHQQQERLFLGILQSLEKWPCCLQTQQVTFDTSLSLSLSLVLVLTWFALYSFCDSPLAVETMISNFSATSLILASVSSASLISNSFFSSSSLEHAAIRTWATNCWGVIS